MKIISKFVEPLIAAIQSMRNPEAKANTAEPKTPNIRCFPGSALCFLSKLEMEASSMIKDELKQAVASMRTIRYIQKAYWNRVCRIGTEVFSGHVCNALMMKAGHWI
jgi:hypothetical protein